ncbi:MAG: heme-binding protein [Actinomycetes bacterium]
MTESQSYAVIDEVGPVEVRHYASCVVADVVITGSIEGAGNRAFGPLVSYIGGRNRGAVSLEMTAPVLQEPAPEKLSMTAPVLQESAGEGRWVVSFVLPGSRSLAQYPQPLDPQVTLRELPAEDAAALRWSGRWSAGNVEQRTGELLAALEGSVWSASGAVRWARFDPPWKPAFLRHNEVVVPVQRADT